MLIYASLPYQCWVQMAEIAEWCLDEDPMERPEMREIVGALSKIVMSSIECEASLCGNSQVFSGLFNGRWKFCKFVFSSSESLANQLCYIVYYFIYYLGKCRPNNITLYWIKWKYITTFFVPLDLLDLTSYSLYN